MEDEAQARATEVKADYGAGQKAPPARITKKPTMRISPTTGTLLRGRHKAEYEKETGLSSEELTELTSKLTSYPAGFHVHPKVKKLLEQRAEMGTGKRDVDYGMAEALAFGSLVKQGIPIRMSGQDNPPRHLQPRGTRCCSISKMSRSVVPLQNIVPGQARCEIYNSTLSEAGVMASSTATAATIRKLWFCGKRSSAISPTSRRP